MSGWKICVSNGDCLALLFEVLLNQLLLFVLAQHPVVVLLVDDLVGDNDLGVLSVELILTLFRVEFGHHRRWLLVQELLAGLVHFITTFPGFAKSLELVEFVDVVGVIRKELLAGF